MGTTVEQVEALMEALQELPVVRKLDLRSNDAITVKVIKAFTSKRNKTLLLSLKRKSC